MTRDRPSAEACALDTNTDESLHWASTFSSRTACDAQQDGLPVCRNASAWLDAEANGLRRCPACLAVTESGGGGE